jgi:transcriptional regulator with XRE-family HTH domain
MKQMFTSKFYIDFFYKHILDIDMVNKVIQELIASNGGNKKVIAEKLGITPQFLGQLEQGKRQKPSAALVAKIKDVYGVDILSGKTSVSQKEPEVFTLPIEVWNELKRNNNSFASTISTFAEALNHLKDDKNKLYAIIDKLLGERSQAAQQR